MSRGWERRQAHGATEQWGEWLGHCRSQAFGSPGTPFSPHPRRHMAFGAARVLTTQDLTRYGSWLAGMAPLPRGAKVYVVEGALGRTVLDVEMRRGEAGEHTCPIVPHHYSLLRGFSGPQRLLLTKGPLRDLGFQPKRRADDRHPRVASESGCAPTCVSSTYD